MKRMYVWLEGKICHYETHIDQIHEIIAVPVKDTWIFSTHP